MASEIDEIKAVWSANTAALDRCIAVQTWLARDELTRRMRWARAPHAASRTIELVAWLALILCAVSVLARHVGEPRYIVAGGALAIYLVGMLVGQVRLVAAAQRIDYGGPIAAAQRELARLIRMEALKTTWAIFGGVLIWLPALLIGVEFAVGVDLLARVDLAWLASNLAFGVVALVVGVTWCRRHIDRAPRSRLVDILASRSLLRIEAMLAEIDDFERETVGATPAS